MCVCRAKFFFFFFELGLDLNFVFLKNTSIIKSPRFVESGLPSPSIEFFGWWRSSIQLRDSKCVRTFLGKTQRLISLRTLKKTFFSLCLCQPSETFNPLAYAKPKCVSSKKCFELGQPLYKKRSFCLQGLRSILMLCLTSNACFGWMVNPPTRDSWRFIKKRWLNKSPIPWPSCC